MKIRYEITHVDNAGELDAYVPVTGKWCAQPEEMRSIMGLRRPSGDWTRPAGTAVVETVCNWLDADFPITVRLYHADGREIGDMPWEGTFVAVRNGEKPKFTLPEASEIVSLLTSLKDAIRDDYRCTDDPDDDTPGMCVTIGASPDGRWNFQTGDNSFTGGAYGHPVWGVVYLYRDTDADGATEDVLDEIAEQMAYVVER